MDAKSSYYSQVATDEIPLDKEAANKTGSVSLYPGMRRTTHGAPPPLDHPPVPNGMVADYRYDGLISVTVPPGVLPGQEIHVRRPDGNGGLVEVVVPPGMKEGSVFYVKAPPPVEGESRNPESLRYPAPTDLGGANNNDSSLEPVSPQSTAVGGEGVANANSAAAVVPNSSSQQGDFANCLDNTTGFSSVASAK